MVFYISYETPANLPQADANLSIQDFFSKEVRINMWEYRRKIQFISYEKYESIPNITEVSVMMYYGKNDQLKVKKFPPKLRELYIFNINELICPIFPDTLKKIQLEITGICSIPKLPNGLEYLFIQGSYSNDLIIPDSVRILTISRNQLIRKIRLPKNIIYFKSEESSIDNITEFPPGIRYIEIGYNHELRRIPDLPDSTLYFQCVSCALEELSRLNPGLIECDIRNNPLTRIPDLPDSITSLFVNHNRIQEIPHLPPRLKVLYCSNNTLKMIPELPATLEVFCCDNNQITRLPDSIIGCRNIRIFTLSNNPVELTPQQVNFIAIINERRRRHTERGYMNDRQNVHNSAVQKSLIQSVAAIMNFKDE